MAIFDGIKRQLRSVIEWQGCFFVYPDNKLLSKCNVQLILKPKAGILNNSQI